jgi:hypothetical protein
LKVDESAKSEEVQVIIDRMPTQWAKYVSLITTILISLIIGSAFIIRYPDTVDGQISVTATIAPVRLIANTSGRLHPLKQNKNILQKGDVIAYIESGADYRDILRLDSLLNQYIPANDHPTIFPFSFALGDLATAYNAFVMADREYRRLKNTDIYKTMREILTRQIATDKDVAVNMEDDLALKDRIIAGSAEQLEKDRTLLNINAITEDVYEEKQQQHLSKEESYLNLKSNLLSKQSDINKNSLEIQRLSLEETETLEKVFSELMSATNTLANMIRLWKEKYLQTAPLDGELEYLSFWRENSFVNSGQELFSIIPDENDIVGEVMIPSVGAGKVEIGQTANVKINKFPYDEYGLLKGRVESISRVSNRIETREGAAEAYQVIISFPDGFVTNFGTPLFLDFESKGTVEIITKPKRLIERLFDNLQAKTEK